MPSPPNPTESGLYNFLTFFDLMKTHMLLLYRLESAIAFGQGQQLNALVNLKMVCSGAMMGTQFAF